MNTNLISLILSQLLFLVCFTFGHSQDVLGTKILKKPAKQDNLPLVKRGIRTFKGAIDGSSAKHNFAQRSVGKFDFTGETFGNNNRGMKRHVREATSTNNDTLIRNKIALRNYSAYSKRNASNTNDTSREKRAIYINSISEGNAEKDFHDYEKTLTTVDFDKNKITREIKDYFGMLKKDFHKLLNKIVSYLDIPQEIKKTHNEFRHLEKRNISKKEKTHLKRTSKVDDHNEFDCTKMEFSDALDEGVSIYQRLRRAAQEVRAGEEMDMGISNNGTGNGQGNKARRRKGGNRRKNGNRNSNRSESEMDRGGRRKGGRGKGPMNNNTNGENGGPQSGGGRGENRKNGGNSESNPGMESQGLNEEGMGNRPKKESMPDVSIGGKINLEGGINNPGNNANNRRKRDLDSQGKVNADANAQINANGSYSGGSVNNGGSGNASNEEMSNGGVNHDMNREGGANGTNDGGSGSGMNGGGMNNGINGGGMNNGMNGGGTDNGMNGGGTGNGMNGGGTGNGMNGGGGTDNGINSEGTGNRMNGGGGSDDDKNHMGHEMPENANGDQRGNGVLSGNLNIGLNLGGGILGEHEGQRVPNVGSGLIKGLVPVQTQGFHGRKNDKDHHGTFNFNIGGPNNTPAGMNINISN